VTVSQAAAVKSSVALGAATKLRCLVGLHAWSTWGVPRVVDVEWMSSAMVERRGWESPQHDTSQGLVRFHQAQERVCLACGRRQRHYFWPSPEAKRSTLEFGGGGYGFVAYCNAVEWGLLAGPPPESGEAVRLDDVVLPMFRDADWPEPVPVLLACRLGLYHFRRYNPEPRFRHERICPFCGMVSWL
jgi:hypothetical protein